MLLFCDGQRHISTALIPRKWTTLNASKCLIEVVPEGRFFNCLRRTATGVGTGPGYVSVSPLVTQAGAWTPQGSGVFQAAIRVTNIQSISTASTAASPSALVSLTDSTRPTAPVLNVVLTPAGTLTLTRYDSVGGGVDLAASAEGFVEDQYQLFEFKWTIGNPGYAQVRINTVPVLTFTGRTLAGGASGLWNGLRFLNVAAGSLTPAPVLRACDVVLMDQQGADDQLRDFLGDVTIDVIIPDGVGTTTQWTPSVGANWTCVNELPANQLAWVSATDAGTQDLYTFTDLPPGYDPIGAHHCILAAKTEAGGASLRPSWRPAGVTYQAVEQGVAAQDAYYYVLQPYDLNPETGLRPTRDEINASQFGHLKTV